MPVPRASRRGRPRKRAAGGITLTPPPSVDDFPSLSLFYDARSGWFEGYTGVPLRGNPVQQHAQFNDTSRSFRHDARGIASRPSPTKVHRVAAAKDNGVMGACTCAAKCATGTCPCRAAKKKCGERCTQAQLVGKRKKCTNVP